MKILYPLLCYFPSEAGGPANTIFWLNKAIGKYSFKSIVISTKFGLRNNAEPSDDLYKNNNIYPEFISSSILSFLLKKQIQKLLKADVIHFSSLFFKPTLFYLFLGLIRSKKIIISPRGELYPSAIERKRIQKLFYIKIMSIFQKQISFHSTNPIETSYIKEYFPKAKSVTEIPNYIELPEKLDIKTKKQILFIGRINPIKNIYLLIQAYSKLPSKIISDFSLIIAGEASLEYEKDYKQQLESLINDLDLKDNISFLGGVYGYRKEVLMAESYCLVLPSKSENFGNVVLETLCQGTPAIVTQNAPWEIIEKYQAGYWVIPTIEILNQAINKIVLLNNTEYDKLRANALNLAVSKFDIEKNIDKWIEFYKN